MKNRFDEEIGRAVLKGEMRLDEAARACKMTHKALTKRLGVYAAEHNLPMRLDAAPDGRPASERHAILRARVFGG